MALCKILPWSFFIGHHPKTTPVKVVKILSQVKYNGKISVFNHLLQFIFSCNNLNIDEDIICKKNQTLVHVTSSSSIHSWDEF